MKHDLLKVYLRRKWRCCGLVWLLSVQLPVSAQLLAQAEKFSDQSVQQSSPLSLVEALTRLKAQYQVNILFEENNLRDHSVSSDALKSHASLEAGLKALLQPLGLRYKKKKNNYIILSTGISSQKEAESPSEKLLLNALPSDFPKSTRELPSGISTVDRVVSGKVRDEKGEALPGVSIMLKGTQQGMITDAEGRFSMEVADENAVLVFSFVGFITHEIVIGARTIVDIDLKVDEKSLDEVVVIGYGTAKKSDLTGSIARVDADIFKNQSVTQVTEMLTGNVAGFYANQSPFAAGGASMEIRGTSSLSAGTSPMIVLDGVVYNGNIRDINPTDIETIDILKDASSAAVFGAKAASGVIVITTSRGKTGKPLINFSTKIGIAEVTRKEFGTYDGRGYLDFRRDYYRSLRGSLPDYYYFSPEELPDGISMEQWRSASANPNPDNTVEWLNRLNFFPIEQQNYLAGKTLNWMDEVLTRGLRQDYDLSVGGGTDNVKYYWSVGYTDNEGIVKGDQFGTIRSRLNLDVQVARWLSVGMNTQFANRDESVTQADLNLMYTASPFGSIWNDDGSIRWYPGDHIGAPNPLMEYYGRERLRKIQSVFASTYAELKLPFGFVHRISYQPRYEVMKDYNYWSPQTLSGGRDNPKGRATREDYSEFGWMMDNLLKWNKVVGAHTFDLTFLHNLEQTRIWRSQSTNITFNPSPVLGFHGMQFGINPTVNSNDSEVSADALMARLNYSFRGKYLLTASVRRDGYSAFGQQNPRAYFPALALAWNVAEESFFNMRGINGLKVRASWGVNGNRDIGMYAALAQLASNLYYTGSNTQVGLFSNSLANSRLRWERTESFNAGLDVDLFSSRLNITADIYHSSTTDLLMSRRLPEITGFSTIMTNLGRLDNRGIELTINSVNINSKKFDWISNLVFSLNRNRVERLFGDYEEIEIDGKLVRREVPDYSNQWFPGKPLDVVWNYDIQGIWQVEEEEAASIYGLVPGDFKAKDVDANGKYEALHDKTFIGYGQPRYRFGLRNDFTFFKNFSASFFIRADLGHIASMPQAVSNWASYDRSSASNVPYWTADNRTNEWPRITQNNAPFGGGIMLYKPRSFARIQDVSLAYTLPVTLARRLLLEDVRIFSSIRNLYSFDKWPGWDPESLHTPMPRTYTFGLNLSLK